MAASDSIQDEQAERPPAVVTVGRDGAVTGWTRAAQELLGYRGADPGGGARPFTRGRPPSWEDRFGGRDHWSGLLEARRRDGGIVLVRADVVRLHGPGAPHTWSVAMTAADAAPEPVGSVLEPLMSRTPIAMLTANATEAHRTLALHAGADGHIVKPITPESLLAGIGAAVAAAPAGPRALGRGRLAG